MGYIGGITYLPFTNFLGHPSIWTPKKHTWYTWNTKKNSGGIWKTFWLLVIFGGFKTTRFFFTYCFTGVSTSQLEIQTSYWHPPSKWGDTLLVGVAWHLFHKFRAFFLIWKNILYSYPVILRILGFQIAPHFVRKYIIPGSKIAPPS